MMRRYIRHPSDIPIEFEAVAGERARQIERLSNVSLGGVSFYTAEALDPGTQIRIRIPFVQPEFVATTEVVWCAPNHDGGFEVGVELLDEDEAFRTRMVEQVCHIEHYKREVMLREGRKLSGEQAASEWINKYAAEFPHIELPESAA